MVGAGAGAGAGVGATGGTGTAARVESFPHFAQNLPTPRGAPQNGQFLFSIYTSNTYNLLL